MATSQAQPAATARLKTQYESELVDQLQKDLQLANRYQVPRIQKIVVSVGLGRAKDDKRAFETAENTLRKITGQQPARTLARKSIAGFKLRAGQPIGLKVTLRDVRMYEFLDRLINIVLPRLRDFHGVSARSFDGRGGFNIGFSDQSVFPELSYEETAVPHGVQVTIVTDTDNQEHARTLLERFGMPFQKKEE